MAFKLILVASFVAFASAGVLQAPVAYSPAAAVSSAYYSTPAVAAVHAAPLAAVHAPAVGATHQSVLRSLGGNQAVSHYSKAVDSAFSSVRKYDTRITNDALSVAHTPVAAYHAAAPVAAYHAPAYHAPAALGYAAAGPVVKAAVPAAVSYSPAAVVAHTTFEGLGVHYAY